MSLPAPLVVQPLGATASSADAAVEFADCIPERAQAFAAVLAESRAVRGCRPGRVEIFAASGARRPPSAPGAAPVWLPHIFCWRSVDEVALAWELSTAGDLRALVDASLEDVERWARRPELLIRLGQLAAETPAPGAAGEHLSFRWLMSNQARAAAALTAECVGIEHVSLHVDANREDEVARVLEVLGLVEVPRPAGIAAPGRWLQGGNARVHLNSRGAKEEERGFPGTAPNHVCFAVADLAAAERSLAALGVMTKRAGSLAQPQLWLRLAGGAVVELQPRL